jgi:hypothetical protein
VAWAEREPPRLDRLGGLAPCRLRRTGVAPWFPPEFTPKGVRRKYGVEMSTTVRGGG